MLFVNLVPASKSGDYMAVWTTWGGITWAISQVLGGFLLDASAGISGKLWIFDLDAYFVLFTIALIVPIFAYLLLRRVREASPVVSVGEFASLFFHGRPFMAVNAMIRFQRARDEQTTVMVTEQLGQSRSPLTVEELLEALSDPRFNVRFEAIISIARREPDPRLTSALCTVLERDEPALGVVAAWALGRLGDPEALDSLRGALDAPYRSIQAHSARSLGTLQDDAITPLLARRLAEEEDLGLKVAFSSALGKLRAEEAVPDMLALLSEHEDRYLQLEIALALARILDAERQFIDLMRAARSDPGTAYSQATAQIVQKYPDLLGGEKADALNAVAESFARGDLDEAVSRLVAELEDVPLPEHSAVTGLIRKECRQQLGLYQASRTDYILLYFLSLLYNDQMTEAV
jgi:HEAT repeat protein